MYLSLKEVRAKKTIHLPPKEEGVFLEILDKKTHLQKILFFHVKIGIISAHALK